jgi:hypothetical protein
MKIGRSNPLNGTPQEEVFPLAKQTTQFFAYERDAEAPQPPKKLRRTLIKDVRKSQLESSSIVGRNPGRVAGRNARDDSRQDAGATTWQ